MVYKGKANRTIIAIDGPAGSGKSTVAKAVAKGLGLLYIDTGAMYRALTLKAITEKTELNSQEALANLARGADIQLNQQGDSLQVLLDGQDVSQLIRKQSVTEKVHFVARVADVRKEMVKLQRKLAQKAQGAVLEGRDIGTVVFPEAKYKFFLDAQPSERIRRRYQELREMGQDVEQQEVARDIHRRDQSDMTRDVAPLLRAEDALYIDTTGLSVEQVAEKIIQRCVI